MATEQSDRRGRVWTVLIALLAALTAAVVAVNLLLVGGGPRPVPLYEVTEAPAPEGAEVAWEIEVPSDDRVLYVRDVGGTTIVSYEERGVVAYDDSGTEQWRDEDARSVFAALSGDRAIVIREDAVSALAVDTGAEQWTISGIDPGSIFQLEGRLVVESTPLSECGDGEDDENGEDCDDEPADVRVLDTDTGEESGAVEGQLMTAGQDGVLVTNEDEDQVRMVDLSGDEQWSTKVDLAHAYGGVLADGLVLVPTGGEGDENESVTALDPETGDELWQKSETEAVAPGPAGTAVAERQTEDGHTELVICDADGQVASVPVPDGDEPAGSALGPYSYAFPGHGDLFVDPQGGRAVDADGEVVAEYDQQLLALTADGPYLLDEDQLVLGSWDSDDEQYSIPLEDAPEEIGYGAPDGVWALDGAVAVAANGALKIYR